MTGFGKAEANSNSITTTVEIKSLNGKQLDVNLKLSPLLKAYEFEIRSILKQSLYRGSLEVAINIKQNGATRPMVINTELAGKYYESISAMAEEFGLRNQDVLGALLKLPEVVSPSTEELPEEDWENVKATLLVAIEELDRHRLDEGQSLEQDLLLRVSNIEKFQSNIAEKEPVRKEKIRQRLEAALSEWANSANMDKNRLEQELIYYIEKLDISEEEVRLTNHCRYFRDVLEEESVTRGKKLNFILQEMGREINTTGSKANDSDIQQWVVKMKDELEKAKEQIQNVL